MYVALEHALCVVVALLLRQTLWTAWTKTSLEIILYPMLLAPFVLTTSQAVVDMPLWTDVLDVWVVLLLLIGLLLYVAMGRQQLHALTACSVMALGMLMHRVMVRIVPLFPQRMAFDVLASQFVWISAYVALLAMDMTYNATFWSVSYVIWLVTELFLGVLAVLTRSETPAMLRDLAPTCVCVIQVLLYTAAFGTRPDLLEHRQHSHHVESETSNEPVGDFLYTSAVSLSTSDTSEMTAEFSTGALRAPATP